MSSQLKCECLAKACFTVKSSCPGGKILPHLEEGGTWPYNSCASTLSAQPICRCVLKNVQETQTKQTMPNHGFLCSVQNYWGSGKRLVNFLMLALTCSWPAWAGCLGAIQTKTLDADYKGNEQQGHNKLCRHQCHFDTTGRWSGLADCHLWFLEDDCTGNGLNVEPGNKEIMYLG